MSTEAETLHSVFSRIAGTYDQHAAIQAEVGQRLKQRLDDIHFEPKRILDLGCGTGAQSVALHEGFPEADIVAMDRVMPMIRQSVKKRGWWKKRFDPVIGNAMQLPLADSTFDLVYSNLMLQGCDDHPAVLANLRRILRPGGLLLTSTLGPDTLSELLQAGLSIRPGPDMAHLSDVQRLGSALSQAGFVEPVLDTDWLTATYSSLQGLLEELESIGAITNAHESESTIDPPTRTGNRVAAGNDILRQNDQFAVTWEIVYASAWAPDEGQPIRTGQGEEASFSVDSLKIRRR